LIFSRLELIQNDEIKQELVKQNGVQSILQYAKESKDDPIPLEITYAMTFNDNAKLVINQDAEFLDHVKELRDSKKKDVSQLAHGIVWKLEGEERFQKNEAEKRKQQAEKRKIKDDTENQTDKKDISIDSDKAKIVMADAPTFEEPTTSYDIMISYCWAQKSLCHQINDRLEKDGFKVWLDRDEMHGSIIESMAEAIEQSRFVFICMSSNYKKSTNCKAEAEYAFNRKSNIIPLLVESNYRADGWLGFLAGSKIYVDFAEKEDEEFEKAYELLIAELERNGLHDNAEQKTKTSPSSTSSQPESNTEKPESKTNQPVLPQTRQYRNLILATMWEESHVQEFLVDNQLEQLVYACESMDGETLIEFYQSCRTTPDRIYPLVNNPRDEHPVSIATFFRFIARLKAYVPIVEPRKVDFRYNFIYPPTEILPNKPNS
jgi:hypothetical protein